MKRAYALLKIYLFPRWSTILLLGICLFAGIVLSLANPLILSLFIDALSTGMALAGLLGMAVLYLTIAVLRQIISVGETYLAEMISLSAINQLRADLALHCLHLDLSFHTSHTPGELIERIDGDVATLGNFFSRFLVSLLGNALLLVGILVILFHIDWRVGTTLSLFTLLSLIIVSSLRNLAAPHWEAERQASAELFGFLEERLAGTEDIRSSGATSAMMRGLAERSRVVLRAFRRAVQMNTISVSSLLFFSALGTAIALALGIALFHARTISIGTVYLIFAYALLLTTPIDQIVQEMRDLQQTSGSLVRILDILGTRSAIEDGSSEKLPDGALSVVFEDVSFHYVDEISVLQHLSFALQPGEVLGLLGRTGSGKSTLAKLLVRFYDPSSGTVRLGGSDLRTVSLDHLRTRIGVVPQEVQILHASVRDNLTLFDTGIDDERVLQALEELGLGVWYRSLPEGLETRLTPGSSGLSAGEAQLLALARVFLRDPGLVILDEASARLDPATERLLEQAIDRLLAGRTAIIIAHRLMTVQRAETIMILEDGRCKEYGAREQLAYTTSSRYVQLMRIGFEEALI